MNIVLQFLIQGSVGFAIGAGTNDLAIRWVFWALFAKKKHEIADAVQQVVSSELMSPEKISARLDAPEVLTSLRQTTTAALTQTAERTWPSIETLAHDSAGLSLVPLQQQFADLTAQVLTDRFADPAFRSEVLRPFLTERWHTIAQQRPADLLPTTTRKLFSDLPDRLAETLLAPEQRERLVSTLAEGVRAWMTEYPTPSSSLGTATLHELARLAGSRTRLLGDELANLLAMPPAQETLRAAIRDAVHTRLASQGTLGSLLSGLSGTAVVETQLTRFCETLPSTLRDRFDDDAGAVQMRGLIETAVRKLLKRTWSELLDINTPGTLERHIRALLDAQAVRDTTRQGFTGIMAAILDTFQHNTMAEAATLLPHNRDVEACLDWLAEALHNALQNNDIRLLIKEQTLEAVHQLCACPIRPPARFLPDDLIPRLADMISRQILAFARGNISGMIERTRFWDIISESIIVYDDKKMEAIARSIANRELRWVTLLGGVIGFIVGIAQGILLIFLK